MSHPKRSLGRMGLFGGSTNDELRRLEARQDRLEARVETELVELRRLRSSVLNSIRSLRRLQAELDEDPDELVDEHQLDLADDLTAARRMYGNGGA